MKSKSDIPNKQRTVSNKLEAICCFWSKIPETIQSASYFKFYSNRIVITV